MTATAIRQKLYDYIRTAKDKKVMAIYTVLDNEIALLNDHWHNEDFVIELNKRTQDYKNGQAKGIIWMMRKNKFWA